MNHHVQLPTPFYQSPLSHPLFICLKSQLFFISLTIFPTTLLLLFTLPVKTYLQQWMKTQVKFTLSAPMCVGLNHNRQLKQRCPMFHQHLFSSSFYPPHFSFRILLILSPVPPCILLLSLQIIFVPPLSLGLLSCLFLRHTTE